MHAQNRKRDIIIAVLVFFVLTVLGLFFLLSIHSQLVSGNGSMSSKESQMFFTIACFVVYVIAAMVIIICCLLKIKSKNDAAKAKEAEEIRRYTYIDPLTQLPNRNAMKQKIAEWIDACHKDNCNGGAFFLDMDNFQSVNNTFGHTTGDLALVECSRRLVDLVGSENIVGRIGGDEYALLVRNVPTQQDLEKFSQRLIDLVKKPILIHGIIVQLNCSVGAMLLNCKAPKADREYNKIINHTEFVLSQAKNTQRGSFCIFNDIIGEEADRQSKMQHSLETAISNNELLIYFQAQYDLSEKKIIGFESLVRWDSKQFGMVSPAQFIPLAEKSGCIKEIGRFVIDKTFAFAKEYEDTNLCISFNCSPIELLQADFVDYVKERFDHYKLKWNSVAIEITESCLIESFDEVVQKLGQLCDYGLLVYLDDFGTGFSSLTYLKNLPINAVKIDKSFIDEISTNKTEKDIVGMIVGLAGKLHLRVIAEGVEIENQLQDLEQCGCNVIQGYYISRPIPKNEVPRLLISQN